jgi:DNA-binding transcriptional MerR regulator
MELSKKPLYNLSLVLQETGLKADTLRAWEKRYGLPNPARSKGGHRLYSDYDLQLINWLVQKQNEGMRISQAVAYWQELSSAGVDPLETLQESSPPITPYLTEEPPDLADVRAEWLKQSLKFNEQISLEILDQAFNLYPPEVVSMELILPVLSEVGESWQRGEISVQQEHFVSEIAVRKLQSLIAAAPNPVRKQQILIGAPAGEYHVISLLIMSLLIKNRGWPVIYLGSNVPLAELEKAIHEADISLAVMSATRLATAAALQEAVLLFSKHDIPTAYSGWIFTQENALINYIPGIFLGSDLNEAINAVEKLIIAPDTFPEYPLPADADQKLIDLLQRKSNAIQQAVLDEYAATDYFQASVDISESAGFLLADIIAALKLGSIDLVQPNLIWASDLVDQRNFTEVEMIGFLSIFWKAIEAELGPIADPVVNYLKGYQ